MSNKTEKFKSKPVIKWLMVCVVFSSLLAGGWIVLQQSDAFPIRSIKMVGELKYNNPTLVKSLVETRVTGNFFTINVAEIHRSLLMFPWIESVSVNRVWPDSIVLRIKEQLPRVVWNSRFLLNNNGEQFVDRVPVQLRELPHLSGPDEELERLFALYDEYESRLNEYGFSIQGMKMDKRHSISIRLNNGINIVLGREHLNEKLKRFLASYDAAVGMQAHQVEAVDLRYANGFAVRWKDTVVSINTRQLIIDAKG